MIKETKKKWNYEKLRRVFTGADQISYNYSQSDQDIFVLSMLDGMRNGTYLELGAGWPEHISNTALLELEFAWTGISIDYVQDYSDQWKSVGRNYIIANALELDFDKLLSSMPVIIDYLSIDCDPASISLEILKRLPLNSYKFRIITFEHEAYCEGPAVKQASREYLLSHGYQLVVNNISHLGIAVDYEDWWVHPDLVDHKKIELHTCIDETIKNYYKYLYR